jgi:hypothetical protein
MKHWRSSKVSDSGHAGTRVDTAISPWRRHRTRKVLKTQRDTSRNMFGSRRAMYHGKENVAVNMTIFRIAACQLLAE